MIAADTSALLAFYNDQEQDHRRVKQFIDNNDEQLILSPYVVAELDYLLGDRLGVEIETGVLHELASGAYELAQMDTDDLARAASVVEKYRDQDIGVTDASLVVLADRYQTKRILTLDHRHFTVLRPLSGGRFKLLP